MARRKIRISRQSLARCPGCGRHAKVTTPLREARCDFCDTLLIEVLGAKRSRGRRGAAVAAGLLTLGMAACDEPRTRTTDPDDDAVVEAGLTDGGADAEEADMPVALPPYGRPPMEDLPVPPPEDAGVADGEVDMPVAQPPYGLPPEEDIGVDAELAPDTAFAPEYGEPPIPDAEVEVDAELAPDFEVSPDYGEPPIPEPDMGVEVDAVLAPDFGDQPEYGGPPIDEDMGVEVDMAPDPENGNDYGLPPIPDDP